MSTPIYLYDSMHFKDLAFITSEDIWLAIDEEDDFEASTNAPMLDGDFISLDEAELFHKQLFYWLLFRCCSPTTSTQNPLDTNILWSALSQIQLDN